MTVQLFSRRPPLLAWAGCAALVACSGNEAPAVTEPTGAPSVASPSQPGQADEPATPAVDGCGKYAVDEQLPERFACETDADCGWTEHRPGSCLGPLCPGDYAEGNRAWIAAAEALNRRVCTGAEFGYCEKVKCINLIPIGAACIDGRCVLKHDESKGKP